MLKGVNMKRFHIFNIFTHISKYFIPLYKMANSERDILIDNKNVYGFEIKFITFFSIISKIILFLFIIGFFKNKPTMFLNISFYVKLLLGFFLIYRFNSFRKHKVVFTELDRKACYSTGIYIVIISFGEYLITIIDKVRFEVTKYTNPYVNHIKKMLNINT